MNDLMTKMEKPGTVIVPRINRTHELHLHLQGLKAQGHAILIDEMGDPLAPSGDLIVYHYLTCTACKKGAI